MLIQDLVSQIDTKDTPIFFHNEPIAGSDYCYARTTTASELAELRGKKDANYRKIRSFIFPSIWYNDYTIKRMPEKGKVAALPTTGRAE